MSDNTKRLERSEIPKHVERAEKLLQKVKPSDALEEYLQVLAADPSNDTIRQMAADICLSLQRIPDAVNLLSELFQRQTEAGDATRASLTYKKLTRFAKPTCEQRIRFGQLLEGSNPKLALETYEEAFQELIKLERKQDALIVIERAASLEPNQKNLLRVAQLSSDLENHKQAAQAYMKVAALAENTGPSQIQWVERAFAEDATDPQIALAYGNNLLTQDQIGAAIFVLAPLATAPSAPPEFCEIYAKALLAANRLTEAATIIWQLFELDSSSMKNVVNLIGLLIDAEQDTEAVELARKLGEHQRLKGDRKTYLAVMQEVVASHRASAEVLEFMSALFNASNRESDYFQTLIRLFDLHISLKEYDKAAEALDRSAEIDAYEPGQQRRLEMVRGKIDENRYTVIASRFTSLDTSISQSRSDDKVLGASTLQDLMLQAEILVQYGMRSKAIERLQRIQELFPREEERNQDLQQLYLAAGLTQSYNSSARPNSPAAPAVSIPSSDHPAPVAAPLPPAQSVNAATSNDSAEMTNFTRISEITRLLYRQTNADTVLGTAVNEIGAQWNVDRCVAAMRKPGLSATLVKERCGEALDAGNVHSLEEVVGAAQDLAAKTGTLMIPNTIASSQLSSVRQNLGLLSVGSLLAICLSDGADHVGVLLLMNKTPHNWSAGDVMMLKTIGEQIVIALNNAGLRRLVKNLSVTDEKSGLLKRASYLDLLIAETRRAVQHNNSLSVLLVRLGDRAAMLKEFGETAVEATMRQIGQLFAANIRQNDLAFRYETTTIAIVLGETSATEGIIAAEKLRKLVSALTVFEKDAAIPFHAGLAEAVVREQFDSVDIVTEVINRAERALTAGTTQASGHVEIVAAVLATAAVA
ncbi:MAG: diguanylate cyclase domain-containing protein [Terriglobales bacterium]